MFRNENVAPVLSANMPPQPSFYAAPSYCYPVHNRCNDFVLIVVLFILLIIVGASFYSCCGD